MRRIPPCFGSSACATLDTASKHRTATSARTLRMLLSLDIFGLTPGRLRRTIAWRGVGATSNGDAGIGTSDYCKTGQVICASRASKARGELFFRTQDG